MWATVAIVLTVLASTALAAPVSAGDSGRTASPFDIRGVVEGFYGPAWTQQERVNTFPWMARHGLNTYVHANKDDPYQRANWRDPYPPGKLADMLAQVAVAHRHGVEWVPNLSPAFPLIPGVPAVGTVPSRDVCFSCPDDLAAIVAKFDPFFDAGVRTFMLAFDDVQSFSTHSQDAVRYGAGDVAYGEMNRDLLNAVYRHYNARAGTEGFRLFTVLAWYFGTSDPTGYFEGIRAAGGLDDGIVVFWTGTDVVSRTISAEDAAAYAGLVGKERIAVWDNFAANDYTGNVAGAATRLFLGPYEGRAPDLARSVSGVLANPMNEAVAARIPLATMADYLDAPTSYDAESAWRSSILDLPGKHASDEEVGAVAALVENSRSGPLNRLESPVFVALTERFLSALDASPFWSGALDALAEELERERGAGAVISHRLPALASDAGPWLDGLAANAIAARSAVDLLAAQRPGLSASAVRWEGGTRVVGRAAPPSVAAVAALTEELARGHAQAAATTRFVHGDRATAFLGHASAGENRLDAFILAAQARTAHWMPTAPAAASRVEVTVDGTPVPLAPDGSFTVDFPHGVVTVEVVARDGAGGETGRRLSLPGHAPARA